MLLGITALLLLFCVYSFGISKTIKAYQEYFEAKNKTELAENAPMMATQLKKELLQMDAKLGGQNTVDQNTAETLLNLITNYCQNNHIVLREFPRTTTANQGDLIIETNQFMVGGSFSTILKLVYILEQKIKLGNVASVKYQLKKDFKTKKMLLTASVFIQHIKQHDHEK